MVKRRKIKVLVASAAKALKEAMKAKIYSIHHLSYAEIFLAESNLKEHSD